MAIYLDSSALVKLVAEEAESAALRDYVERSEARLVSSDIAAVEVGRAARRYAAEERGETVVRKLARAELDAAILTSAVEMDPPALSALDAIHLATALSLVNELSHFVSYDLRLVDAARAAGLTVASPT